MRGVVHPPEFRAQVLADIASGESLKSVSSRYHLSRTTLQLWSRDAQGANRSAIQNVHETREVGQPSRMPALLNAYIEQGIATLTKQLEVTSREEYIMKQSAGSLAILHGVTADKLLRVLAAIRPVEPGSTQDR